MSGKNQDCHVQVMTKQTACEVTPSRISNLESAKAKSSAGKDEDGGDHQKED